MNKNTLVSLVLAGGSLTACGGGTNNAPPLPSASSFDLTVGKTVSKTIAEVAALARMANFTPTSLTMTDGTFAKCTYDPVTHTLTVSPKFATTEIATEICTATFIDVGGAALGPVNLNLKNIDNKDPVITLSGNSTVDLVIGTTWTDPGASATDGLDGNVPITTTGTVNTAVSGTYTITYTSADRSGNTVSVTRTVNVVSPSLTSTPTHTDNGTNIDNSISNISLSNPNSILSWVLMDSVLGTLNSGAGAVPTSITIPSTVTANRYVNNAGLSLNTFIRVTLSNNRTIDIPLSSYIIRH